MLRRVIAALGATVVLGFASTAKAQVPNFLTEEGKLLDGSGNPITTPVTMTFSIYTVATAGTAAWTEKQTVPVDAGFFSAVLGATAFPATLFNGQELWLGLTVNSDAEMTPRQPILSTPYAFTANNAIGDITPTSVSITGPTGPVEVINGNGQWVGPGSGLVGPTGPAGAAGAQGPAGTAGVQGPAGPTGPDGVAGAKGATGPAGAVGPAGAQGPAGPQGAVGAQGPAGAVGAQGPAGPGGVIGAGFTDGDITQSGYQFPNQDCAGNGCTVTPTHAMNCYVQANGLVQGTTNTTVDASFYAVEEINGTAQPYNASNYGPFYDSSTNAYQTIATSWVYPVAAGSTYTFGCYFYELVNSSVYCLCSISYVCL